jgi:spore photoproduct lyase
VWLSLKDLKGKKKHREAAFKAWTTIKKEKRQKAAEHSQKISRFIEAKAIQQLRHPEAIHILQKPELEWKGNRIVVPFDKTPSDIACGMFWELRWAYGCPLSCSYCYLRGTMRGRMKPQYVRTEQVLQALDEAFTQIQAPAIFNAGELSDALMNPEMMIPIVDKFEEQNKHKVYLLTKFGEKNVEFLLEKPRKQVICGWSINAPSIAKLWERSAATPEERIQAAKRVSEKGYDVRVRIDPIFPIDNWRSCYSELLEQLLKNVKPNRIILGTPRGLWKTIKYAGDSNVDLTWAKFFKEDSSWGRKMTFEQRKEISTFFYGKLDSLGYPLSKVSVCKETVPMIQTLGINYSLRTCNCYGRSAL